MKSKVEFNSTKEGLIMTVDNIEVDKHFKATDREDFLNKAAFMLFKHLGWEGRNAEGINDIVSRYNEMYCVSDGEDAYEFYRRLPATTVENNINSVRARMVGFSYFKELIDRGFQGQFAASTAYNFSLIKINPDSREIFEVFGINC